MRTVIKNRRVLYYANPIGVERVVIDGVITPDEKIVYTTPTQIKVNYSASAGQETTEIFGNTTQYSKLITVMESPMVEGSLVWIDKPTTEKANYKVVKVAKSINSYLLALNEII